MIFFTVTLGCGGNSNQNCTYFESSGTASAGACVAKICPCNSNVCQVYQKYFKTKLYKQVLSKFAQFKSWIAYSMLKGFA